MNEQLEPWTGQNEGVLSRHYLIKQGLTKLFVSNNRSVGAKLIEGKTTLLEETLRGLATQKIDLFFNDIRNSFETLPSDGQMKKTLNQNMDKYGPDRPVVQQIERNYHWTKDDEKFFRDRVLNDPDFSDLWQEILTLKSNEPNKGWTERMMARMTKGIGKR